MKLRASFLYDGKTIFLEPSSMVRETEACYTYCLPDGLRVIYEVKPFTAEDSGEEGFLTLLRFRNEGNGNTGRISRAKTADIVLEGKSDAPVFFHGMHDSGGQGAFGRSQDTDSETRGKPHSAI